jgi:hypothetical protein
MASVDKLVKTYVKIREAKAKCVADHKMLVDGLDNQIDLISNELMEAIKATGGTAIKTDFGTATRVVRRRFWTADKDAFITFALENDARGLLDIRVMQKNTGEWIDANPENIPDGINIESKYDVQVRAK